MKLYYSNLVLAATLLSMVVADPSRDRTHGRDRGRNHGHYRVPDGNRGRDGNRARARDPGDRALQLSDHNCCVNNPDFEAGCCNAECEAEVCAIDLYCCFTDWDSLCAQEATDMCEACSDGDACNRNCCETHGQGTGCCNVACEDTVCTIDPYCCNTAWDGICAGEAKDLCGNLCHYGGDTCCPTCQDNPCFDGARGKDLYHRHCDNRAKFIQCNAWGKCFEMPCADGTVWNDDANTCVHG